MVPMSVTIRCGAEVNVFLWRNVCGVARASTRRSTAGLLQTLLGNTSLSVTRVAGKVHYGPVTN